MGAKHREPCQLSFNGSLRVDLQGSRVTSDGGLSLVRALDERLGFSERIAQHLTESRRGKNTPRAVANEMTIKRHRARVMQKMEAESLTEMVRMAEKLGIPSTTYLPEYPKVS
jgi:Bacterial regulatory proteins, luxR family